MTEPPKNPETQVIYVEAPRKRKGRFGCFSICFLMLIAVLVVAAIKNPSETESRELIQKQIVEKVNENVRKTISDEDKDAGTQIGAALVGLFMPKLLDYAMNVDINDYVIFSTFTITPNIPEAEGKYMKGIIVFGKVIGTSTNIDFD